MAGVTDTTVMGFIRVLGPGAVQGTGSVRRGRGATVPLPAVPRF